MENVNVSKHLEKKHSSSPVINNRQTQLAIEYEPRGRHRPEADFPAHKVLKGTFHELRTRPRFVLKPQCTPQFAKKHLVHPLSG